MVTSTDTLNIAFMGTGNIARKCLPAAASVPGLRVSHVASRSPERARAFIDDHAELIGESAVPIGYGDVANDPQIDAVYITMPNHLHVGWSLKLLGAGKHVLCEKPLTPFLHEAQRVIEAAQSAGKVWQEGFFFPHHPQTDTIHEIATAGREDEDASPIGRLVLIRAWQVSDLGTGPHVEHRLRRSTQGGAMQDVGVYPLGIARSAAGEVPEALHAIARPAPVLDGESGPVDAMMLFTGRFPSGALFEGATGLDTHGGSGVELIGTRGIVRSGWPYWPHETRAVLHLERRNDHPDGPGTAEIVIENAGDRIELQFRDFAAACLGNGPIKPSWAWSLAQAKSLEALYASAGIDLPESPEV